MSTSCPAVELETAVASYPSTTTPDVRIFAPCDQKFLVFQSLVIPLGHKRQMIIGSDPATCDLVLLSPRVNDRHAVIFYHGGCYFIRDLSTLFGTSVNGRRIAGPTELHVGDFIHLKPYTIRFTDRTLSEA